MSLTARCQLCGEQWSEWTVRQITLDVRTLRNYKLQACEPCQRAIERALVEAFETLKGRASTFPESTR